MKKKRFVILKKAENLKETQKEELQQLMNNNEGMYRAYLLKEQILLIFDDKKRITGSLKKTGQYQEELENEIFDRIEKARVWLEKYAPDEIKFSVQEKVAEIQLSDKQKEAIKILVVDLKEKEWDEKALFNRFYEICKSTGLESKDFFRTGYQVLLNKERGPKLAPFVLALGEKAIELFEEAVRR